ncbi:MATE family efflux transporter [Alloiococcus sp. CFN-8]|uniref:MATE family efflux transporter n=1 Tax=Alloiococcus sp. CFN-8 TaxID=3416081 RepID=UPI003CEA501E
MNKNIDLTKGSITKKMITLALPIMGTSFLQTAYNITDMFWIGRVGTKAVAAVGTAGYFTWLANAFIMISKVGAEVKVAQNLGKRDMHSLKNYISTALQINIILGIIYTLGVFLLREPLIDYFKLGDSNVISMAHTYLKIICIGLPAYFINPVFTAIFNGAGNSSTPLKINTIGLVFNMIFDPLLIYGLGPIKPMGVAGAAIATILAQILVTICFIIRIIKGNEEYLRFKVFDKVKLSYYSSIIRLGIPVAFQSGLFTMFSMVIGRIIAAWGAEAIGIQKIGSQIEAISWMTANGLSTALSAFTGQNFGAGKKERVIKGYGYTMAIASVVGLVAMGILMIFGEALFSAFVPGDTAAISMGKSYMFILGYSQLFMCIEITTSGAFNGLGRTLIPSIISIVFTGLRIPAALLLSGELGLGLDGVWWSISGSSIIKGILLTLIFIIIIKRDKLFNNAKGQLNMKF